MHNILLEDLEVQINNIWYMVFSYQLAVNSVLDILYHQAVNVIYFIPINSKCYIVRIVKIF